MGGQHSQKVAVKKPTLAVMGIDIIPPKATRKKKAPKLAFRKDAFEMAMKPLEDNPLAGERRPPIKPKMKVKRWV